MAQPKTEHLARQGLWSTPARPGLERAASIFVIYIHNAVFVLIRHVSTSLRACTVSTRKRDVTAKGLQRVLCCKGRNRKAPELTRWEGRD